MAESSQDKAKVQLENGYTRIANELLEVICGANFNATQLRIILCVIRFTYGFNRKECEMSVSYLSNATGISKRYVSTELNKLIDSKVILIVKNYSVTTSRILMINKNYFQWVGYGTIQQVNDTSTGEEQFIQEINNKKILKKIEQTQKMLLTFF